MIHRPSACICCGQRLEWHAVPQPDGSVAWVQRDPGSTIGHAATCVDNPFTAAAVSRPLALRAAALIAADVEARR